MFQNIISTIKKGFSFLKLSHKGSFDINPYRDWLILIILMLVVGVLLVTIAVYLFVIINTDEGANIETVGALRSEVVHVDALKEVLKLFKEKEILFQELFSNRPEIIDPSL
ncbi:MAG: hypothetical protein HYT93_02075 [Parcubacteria group bacterium]|nr:hypothetical protein [Parcubacteria group bacterium]